MDIITIISIAGFSVCLLGAYRRGISDGARLAGGQLPEPVRSPAAVVQEHKEKKKTEAAQDLINAGVNNIFSYDPQKTKE